MRFAAVGAIIGGVALSATAACRSLMCTEIGCQDQLGVGISGPDSAFPPGAHRVIVVADGTTHTCDFTLPLPTLPGGGTAAPNCGTGLSVTIGPATTCTETRTETATVLTCTPIPGRTAEGITIFGKPAQVRLQQSVDGTSIVDRAVTPSYQATRPNGPDCEPTCQQAAANWTLP